MKILNVSEMIRSRIFLIFDPFTVKAPRKLPVEPFAAMRLESMDLSKTLITLGLGLLFLGVVVKFAAKVPWLFSWLGNLPGDIRYQGERTFVYAPLVSMMIVSAVLSLILWAIQRLGR